MKQIGFAATAVSLIYTGIHASQYTHVPLVYYVHGQCMCLEIQRHTHITQLTPISILMGDTFKPPPQASNWLKLLN